MYRRLLSSFAAIALFLLFIQDAHAVTVSELPYSPDPGIFYRRSDTPLTTGIVTCSQPGGNIMYSGSATSTTGWKVSVGSKMSAGLTVLVKAELSSTFGVNVGSSTTVSASKLITPWDCWSATIAIYPAFQKRIYQVWEGADTWIIAVYIPVPGGAVHITRQSYRPAPICPGCLTPPGDQKFGIPGAPKGDISDCWSDNPDDIPVLSECGKARKIHFEQALMQSRGSYQETTWGVVKKRYE